MTRFNSFSTEAMTKAEVSLVKDNYSPSDVLYLKNIKRDLGDVLLPVLKKFYQAVPKDQRFDWLVHLSEIIQLVDQDFDIEMWIELELRVNKPGASPTLNTIMEARAEWIAQKRSEKVKWKDIASILNGEFKVSYGQQSYQNKWSSLSEEKNGRISTKKNFFKKNSAFL